MAGAAFAGAFFRDGSAEFAAAPRMRAVASRISPRLPASRYLGFCTVAWFIAVNASTIL
jgi:hypothetical protein